jgi:hypothetical protein
MFASTMERRLLTKFNIYFTKVKALAQSLPEHLPEEHDLVEVAAA